jgi:CRISPR-associated protein Csd2
MSQNLLTNRHDFLILFEVTNGNPNGDPDAGNMPRFDPNTNKGIVSDVCLKRKVRNFINEFKPERKPDQDNGYNIFVQQGAVLNLLINEGVKAAVNQVGTNADDDIKAKAAMEWLCREFFDIRTFGAVISTGEKPMKGSAYGQVRGPVQFTFGQSFHPVNPLDITITRCAVTKEEDKAKERTMGSKYIVPYALYAAKGYVSPPFAERTGFTEDDLNLLFGALLNMFEHDRSAARGEMVVRGLYDFEHVGTQHENNAGQNKREARLGCAHAHKLFEGIKVELAGEAKEKGFPESFADYQIICEWDNQALPSGVKLHKLHEA